MSVQTSTMPMNKPLLAGIASGLIAALIWGAWPVLSRAGVAVGGSLTALDITALRFGVAGLILLPVLLRLGLAGIAPLPVLLLSVGAGAPYVMTAVTGLSMAPATHAGIIIPSCMLSFTALGGWLFLGDRPSRTRLAGMAAILAGVGLVGSKAFLSDGAPFDTDTLTGDALFVASGLLWAIYTLSARRWNVGPLHATALVSVVSLILFAPVYALTADWAAVASAPLTEITVQAVGQGVVVGILALLFYTKAVGALGAARGSLFAALVPGLAAVMSYPVLGEAPGVPELAGLAVVTTGMVVAIRAR